MTDYTTELIKLILESEDIEQAVKIASAVISDLLREHELHQ